MWKRLSALAIRYGLIPLAHNLIRAYLGLIRKTILQEERILRALEDNQKVVIAILHQRMFGVIGYAQRFGRFSLAAIISQSRDGDMIAQVVSRLNFHPVRGSSSMGGKEALDALIAYLTEHQAAVHTIDGPQGPKGVVKAGIIRIAQCSGALIFPVFISTNRAWILKSWDHFLIPKPFSRVLIRWGEPLQVPDHLTETAFESMRKALEERIITNHALDDLAMGWDHPL
ncbi:MAG: lysophospholipid acyltransferase family protein [Syntrophales bacterium LBB04]|nr:lysophospholipid acyltransferase family protein [Syntrophales bacterium LBB04]